MVSRRAVLAILGTTVTGCVSGPILPVPRIDDQPCPPPDLPEGRAVCSHRDSAGGIDVSASPSAVSTAPESLQAVRLLVENRTKTPLRYTPSNWRLYRNAGTGWNRREGANVGPRDVETMPPGGSASWSGIDGLFDLGAAGRTPAGLYAAVLPVQPDVNDGVEREIVACVFLFRVAKRAG